MIVTDFKILRQVSKPTSLQEVDSLKLVSKLIKDNKTAWTKGAGLSAIQIGIPLRFAWYRYQDKDGVLLNPIILKKYGNAIQQESCLSIPNRSVEVERALDIEYLTNGKKKKAHGFLARLIQHEIDHMDGILIVDKKKGR